MNYYTMVGEEGFPSCFGVREHAGKVHFNTRLNPDRDPEGWDGISWGAFRLPLHWQPIWL